MIEQVLRSRLTTARLETGTTATVVLDKFGTGLRVRIPLAAVETVRVRPRRRIEIVLTAGPGEARPVTYSLRPTSGAAAQTFADAVNAAVPVRDAAEPRLSGARQVSTVPKPPRAKGVDSAGAGKERAKRWFFGLLFAAGTVLACATGDKRLIIAWLVLYAMFLTGCQVVHMVRSATVDWWVLRRRGITVVATYLRTESDEDSEGQLSSTDVYRLQDDRGVKRTYKGNGRLVATDPDRIEVTYDPLVESRMKARREPMHQVVFFLAYLFLGIPISVLTVMYPVVFLLVALSEL
ncbi:hypothetical protein ACIRF8_31990 [Streptomyces sp. NPDC102406]|uniref:hypothetical protein n=1 Tax=Streptomyces sp. NPDC102406 TaxID=3366171 RepID=UPI00381D0638